MDQGLSLVIKAYPFPVFVLGAEKILDYFRRITHNEKSIVRYVNGNFRDATDADIRETLRPYLNDWEQVRQIDLFNKVRAAEDENRLSKGIREVRRVLTGGNARLLVVEKGLIEEEVDAVMEKVLAAGGEIQFVEDGVLKDYDSIVLIRPAG